MVIQQGSARFALGWRYNEISLQEKEETSREQEKGKEARQEKGKTNQKNNAQQEEDQQAGNIF